MITAAEVRQRLARREPRTVPREPTTKLAAVSLILRAARELEVLLIKRAEHPRDPWSGHMAFPGGRKDEEDRDLAATAIREVREEVGIALDAGELAGRLDDVQAIARARPVDLVIVPHVFVLAREVELAPDPREVELALWAALGPMLTGESRTTRSYARDGVPIELPGWRVGEHVVWGLTYRMLELLFDVLRA